MPFLNHQIISSVCLIKNNESAGSCFIYHHKQVVYLVTAAHLFPKDVPPKTIEIFHNNNWELLSVNSYISAKYDMAILQTGLPINPGLPNLDLSGGGYILGQDMYMVGFPYPNGISYTSLEFNRNRPLPFVKKTCLSGASPNHDILFLDGHNNQGFSGGPVVFYDYQEHVFKVLGVISGYISHIGEVISTSDTKLFYQENSGIAIAYNIRHALDIIEREF